MNQKLIIIIFSIAILLGGCCHGQKLYDVAPPIIPGTTQVMNSPGFWIGQHPYPDKIFLDRDQIVLLNARMHEQGLTRDVINIGSWYRGQELSVELNKNIDLFRKGKYHRGPSASSDKEFYQALKKNMDLEQIDAKVKVRYGLINRSADQRLMPTTDPIYAEPGDVHFDQVQNSVLALGEALAVLHESRDGQWVYALGPSSDGWVEKAKVSFFPEQGLREYLSRLDFCVVVADRADLFLDEQMTVYNNFVSMGSRLVLAEYSDDLTTEVMVPCTAKDGQGAWCKVYIATEAIHRGYLPYTARHIIQQAFSFLNTPYGWGGMHAGQDCSSFVQKVFSCCGILFPRNSLEQAKVGTLLAQFSPNFDVEKKKSFLLNEAISARTLIRLDGHIMLFLGVIEQEPYAIHATWGYRERGGLKEYTRLINRVAVTGLGLGKGSSRGSLLERIISVNDVFF